MGADSSILSQDIIIIENSTKNSFNLNKLETEKLITASFLFLKEKEIIVEINPFNYDSIIEKTSTSKEEKEKETQEEKERKDSIQNNSDYCSLDTSATSIQQQIQKSELIGCLLKKYNKQKIIKISQNIRNLKISNKVSYLFLKENISKYFSDEKTIDEISKEVKSKIGNVKLKFEWKKPSKACYISGEFNNWNKTKMQLNDSQVYFYELVS